MLLHIAVKVLTSAATVAPSTLAACSYPKTPEFVARVGSQSVPLATDKLQRLPYAADIQLVVRPASELKALSVAYSLDHSAAGARQGVVVAAQSSDKCAWSAPLPRLHVNETGSVRVDEFSAPTSRAAAPARTALAVALMQELENLPSGLAPDALSAEVVKHANNALAALYSDPQLVVRESDGTFRPVADHLAESVSADLSVANVAADVGTELLAIRDAANAIGAAGAAPAAVTACAPGTTTAAIAAAAQRLVAGGTAAIREAIANQQLPWPSCVTTLFQTVATANSGGKGVAAAGTKAQDALTHLALIENNAALASLIALSLRVEALQQATLSVATVDVPVGGDMLERYTQSDVMTVILPDRYHLIQPFATIGWYAFNANGLASQFTAPVEPHAWGERFAIQLGYPVGSAFHPADVRTDPQYLVGIQLRLNSVLSVSSGAVVAKVQDVQRGVWYFGTNMDVSNLGPLQQLFARRDQP